MPRTAAEELESTLHGEIPISRAMGVTVVSWDGRALVLHAPLRENLNHKRTAFGGSLSAVAMLAGWGWLWLFLRERELAAKVVIKENTVAYLRPVASDFEAVCRRPEATALERFLAMLARRGMAQIGLACEIRPAGGGQTAATFRGTYAALPPSAQG